MSFSGKVYDEAFRRAVNTFDIDVNKDTFYLWEKHYLKTFEEVVKELDSENGRKSDVSGS